MKFLLVMHMNPQIWDALTDEERQEVMEGHGAFMDTIRALCSLALAFSRTW